jgi:hypothetical protein
VIATVIQKAAVLLAKQAGFDVVRKNFYSPIPDLRELDPGIWETRSSVAGIELDSGAQFDHLEASLAPFAKELTLENLPGLAPVFSDANIQFGLVDATLLYVTLRYAKPKRILEFGSGYSTLVTCAAAAVNAQEGYAAQFTSVDPYPPEFLIRPRDGLTDLRKMKLADVPLAEYLELDANDVLFVDTTHTVKLGGDVNRVILDVLPELRPGVLVHFHDIFLPWEYPREWFERDAHYWAEQYLLQAFLCFNRDYEIVLAAQFLARDDPDRLAKTIRSFEPGVRPGSFWLRRRLADGVS